MCHVVGVLIQKRQGFDARHVDDAATEIELVHFSERGGMLSFARMATEVAGTQIEVWLDGIDQTAFAHARLSADQRGFIFQQVAEGIQPLVVHHRGGDHLVAYFFVNFFEGKKESDILFIVQIAFVKNNGDRYFVGLGHEQKAIDEAGLHIGSHDGNDQNCLVDVGCDQVHVVFSPRRLPYHEVAPGKYFADHALPFLAFKFHLYAIAHRYRIGERYVVQPEFAADAALPHSPGIVDPDVVPAAGRFYDGSYH